MRLGRPAKGAKDAAGGEGGTHLFNLRVQRWSDGSRVQSVAGKRCMLPWHLCTRTCWHTGRRSLSWLWDRNGVRDSCLGSVARDTVRNGGNLGWRHLGSCRRGCRRIANGGGRSFARRSAHCGRCRKRRIKRANVRLFEWVLAGGDGAMRCGRQRTVGSHELGWKVVVESRGGESCEVRWMGRKPIGRMDTWYQGCCWCGVVWCGGNRNGNRNVNVSFLAQPTYTRLH